MAKTEGYLKTKRMKEFKGVDFYADQLATCKQIAEENGTAMVHVIRESLDIGLQRFGRKEKNIRLFSSYLRPDQIAEIERVSGVTGMTVDEIMVQMVDAMFKLTPP